MSLQVQSLYVSASESIQNRILPHLQNVSFIIDHFSLLVSTFTFISAMMREMPALDKIFDRT